MPEPQEILVEMWQSLVLPALATALGLMLAAGLLLRWLGAVWLMPLAAALALVVSVHVGNESNNRDLWKWQYDQKRSLTASDLALVLGWALETKPPSRETEAEES